MRAGGLCCGCVVVRACGVMRGARRLVRCGLGDRRRVVGTDTRAACGETVRQGAGANGLLHMSAEPGVSDAENGQVLIYLDNNATTRLDEAVREAMLPWLGGMFGNASSIHGYGQQARCAVDVARERVAAMLNAQPGEIVFTGGGTEADNLAILGAVAAAGEPAPRVVTSAVEHPAVLGPCARAAEGGGSLVVLPVDGDGLLRADALDVLPGDHTVLVSVMLANNEVGTLQPVDALSRWTREHGVLLHTDAVQAVGRIPVDVEALGVDLLSLSGHKLHGPQGVGALYVRAGARLLPRSFGGHQEGGRRPGTENVAGIVGLGMACEIARRRMAEDAARIAALRDGFEAAILGRIPGATINGRGAPRLPNTSNVSFDGVEGETIVIGLDLLGLAASTGAACGSKDEDPSHVLTAMGRTRAQARSSVRFSFGRDNSPADVDCAVDWIARTVAQSRERRR